MSGKTIAYKPLTKQQRLAVDIYLNNGRKGTDAVIKAGFSKKAAKPYSSRLFNRPDVLEIIAAHGKGLIKLAKGSADWKKKRLLQVMEYLIEVKKGKVTALKDAKAFLKAMAEHNKMEGHYSAEKVVNHNYNADTDLETLKKETARQEEILAKHRQEF